MTADREHQAILPDSEAGNRLDQTLARLFPQYSRARLQAWIREGRVRVDGAACKPRDTVFGGESVTVVARLEPVSAPKAEAIALTVVWEDEHALVVDKPPGLVVHPGAGNPDGTLVNALLHRDATLAALPRAGLIHRLDKDTSGLLLVARTGAAFQALTDAMAARRIHREYTALCVGALSGGGTIDAPVGRHPTDRKKMAVTERGRDARTHYRIARRFRGYTLVDVTLDTGRTHQIRVHFAHLRHPLVGDRVYGRPAFPRGAGEALREALAAFPRQALHARKLRFEHPAGAGQIECEAPLPADLTALLAALDADPTQVP